MSAFSDNLTKYREKANISRKELAAILGVSVASIGFYETGRNEPDLQKLVTIAAALHVSVDDLLGYHVDDFDKAAALFHEATGYTATLSDEGVVMTRKDGGRGFWLQPISKAAFVKAINDAAAQFDRNLRPRLLTDAILRNIDRTYLQEQSRTKDGKAYNVPENVKNQLLQGVLRTESWMTTDAEKDEYRAFVRNYTDILDKWHEEHDADATPPAQDHDDTDDEKAKEKGPHSNE